MNNKEISVLLIGGPADGRRYAADIYRRFIEIVTPDEPALALNLTPGVPMPNNFKIERATYAVTPMMDKHHEVFRVGVRNMNECPLLALLTNYRVRKDDDGDEWAAKNHVTLIGGDGDGCHVHVPFGIDRVTLNATYTIENVSYNGNTYRVGLLDPDASAIKALILGYRVPNEADLEKCRYCGIRFESPCDAPPTGICEKAANKFYGDPTK